MLCCSTFRASSRRRRRNTRLLGPSSVSFLSVTVLVAAGLGRCGPWPSDGDRDGACVLVIKLTTAEWRSLRCWVPSTRSAAKLLSYMPIDLPTLGMSEAIAFSVACVVSLTMYLWLACCASRAGRSETDITEETTVRGYKVAVTGQAVTAMIAESDHYDECVSSREMCKWLVYTVPAHRPMLSGVS